MDSFNAFMFYYLGVLTGIVLSTIAYLIEKNKKTQVLHNFYESVIEERGKNDCV